MIVVVGRPALALAAPGDEPSPGGLAALVAMAAASRGVRVELVGSVGEDPAGDAVAIALGRAGVGHAALLRDPAGVTPVTGGPRDAVVAGPSPRLDPADIELGLRYLSDCRVLVIADGLSDAVATVAMDAAAYHAAAVVAVVPAGAPVPGAFEEGATVLSAPAPDEDGDADEGRFAGLVAGFAVGLAEGRPAGDALARAAAGGGWERASEG